MNEDNTERTDRGRPQNKTKKENEKKRERKRDTYITKI